MNRSPRAGREIEARDARARPRGRRSSMRQHDADMPASPSGRRYHGDARRARCPPIYFKNSDALAPTSEIPAAAVSFSRYYRDGALSLPEATDVLPDFS